MEKISTKQTAKMGKVKQLVYNFLLNFQKFRHQEAASGYYFHINSNKYCYYLYLVYQIMQSIHISSVKFITNLYG